MNNEQAHKERHEELHKALDELVANFIKHTRRSLGVTTINELIHWSYRQTIEPQEASGGNGGGEEGETNES